MHDRSVTDSIQICHEWFYKGSLGLGDKTFFPPQARVLLEHWTIDTYLHKGFLSLRCRGSYTGEGMKTKNTRSVTSILRAVWNTNISMCKPDTRANMACSAHW